MINVHHIYTTNVEVIFESTEGVTLRCHDSGTLDDIVERVCEILVKHNFCIADICSESSGEILTVVERRT